MVFYIIPTTAGYTKREKSLASPIVLPVFLRIEAPPTRHSVTSVIFVAKC